MADVKENTDDLYDELAIQVLDSLKKYPWFTDVMWVYRNYKVKMLKLLHDHYPVEEMPVWVPDYSLFEADMFEKMLHVFFINVCHAIERGCKKTTVTFSPDVGIALSSVYQPMRANTWDLSYYEFGMELDIEINDGC